MSTITIYTIDGDSIFAGAVDVDPMGPVPPGVLVAPPITDGPEVAQWDGQAWRVLPQRPIPPAEPEPPAPSQFARDEARYRKRAAVKDELLSYMAADNMSRVRAQEWTVADLTGLVADPAVKATMDFMGTLSFELAAQSIATASTPLLTPAIRADWIARLQAHFYLEG